MVRHRQPEQDAKQTDAKLFLMFLSYNKNP